MYPETDFLLKLLIQTFFGIALFRRHIHCVPTEVDSSCEVPQLPDKCSMVHGFDCIFLDHIKRSSLNCSFRRPTVSSSKTSYHLQHLSVDKLCQPELTSNRIECNFQSEDFSKFRSQYNFMLRIEDEVGSRTQNISIDRAECMVLEPPGMEVVELNKTSSSICLQWPNMRWDNHNYGIKWDYRLEPNASIAWQDPQYARLKETFCITSLPQANQEYKLQMRRRINAVRAHWSDYFTYTFRTQLKPNISSESAKLSAMIILQSIIVCLNLLV